MKAMMKDQTRNLNPTPEAVAAMWLWGKRYSEQRGGSMDFWDTLSASEKRLCKDLAEDVVKAYKRHHGRISVVG